MLYTSIEKVKQHLTAVFPIQDNIFDQSLALIGNEPVTFFGGAVNESSVKVKSIQSNDLSRQNVTLGNPVTTLSDTLILRDSVVLSSDSSLGTVYIENVDYIIDYQSGQLKIKNGGALTAGQQVTIWYANYAIYIPDLDYTLNASDGSIRRIPSGGIADGETVYLDYSPIFQSYTDELLQNAVDETNSVIEKSIDPDQQFGVEPILQASATYRALEIISRSSAARELSSLRGEDRVALAWLKLAEEFKTKADSLLRSFSPPFKGPSAPVHS